MTDDSSGPAAIGSASAANAGSLPATTLAPATASELARLLADNASGPRQRLLPAGGRTALPRLEDMAQRAVLALTDLNRVIDYPARDLTITVEAGLRVADLQRILSEQRQRLPVDIADAHRATIGGAVAAGASGPRRLGHGSLRDYLIGVTALDATGRTFKAGGRVVKNVAGYDLCKLLCHSQGSLAVISQLTFKLRPQVPCLSWLWVPIDTLDEIELALELLLGSRATPIAIEVLNPLAAKLIAAATRSSLPVEHPVLCVAVEGSPAEVTWQLDTLSRELASVGPRELVTVSDELAESLLAALTEFAGETDVPATVQATFAPSRWLAGARLATERGLAWLVRAGSGVAIGQIPERTSSATEIRQLAESLVATYRAPIAGRPVGNLLFLHSDQSELTGRYAVAEPSWPLARQIKAKLDPDGLLIPCPFAETVSLF